MYAGHYGLALGAKGLYKDTPLWMLLGAAFSPDLLGIVLHLLAVESPEVLITSLPGTVFIAAVLGGVCLTTRGRPREAGLIVLLVLSHLLADFVTAEISLWPGHTSIGLNLYQHRLWDLILEGLLVVGGWLVYRRSLPQAAGRRSWAAWSMVAVVIGFHVLFLFDSH